MSRYLLLLILTLPFILLAILSAITRYKLGRLSKSRLIVQLLIWILLSIGIASAESLYAWLFQNHLTVSEPLSLFDVIQITLIIIILFITSYYHAKIDTLEKRFQDLHQELSIRLSSKK